MNCNKNKYSVKHIAAAIFMALTLAWLTVSLPFAYADQQQKKTLSLVITADEETPGAEENNPFSNSTEEKSESGSSLSEYLHHIHELNHPADALHALDCTHDVSVYVAFHGEMHCPPPNIIFA